MKVSKNQKVFKEEIITFIKQNNRKPMQSKEPTLYMRMFTYCSDKFKVFDPEFKSIIDQLSPNETLIKKAKILTLIKTLGRRLVKSDLEIEGNNSLHIAYTCYMSPSADSFDYKFRDQVTKLYVLFEKEKQDIQLKSIVDFIELNKRLPRLSGTELILRKTFDNLRDLKVTEITKYWDQYGIKRRVAERKAEIIDFMLTNKRKPKTKGFERTLSERLHSYTSACSKAYDPAFKEIYTKVLNNIKLSKET